RFRGKPDSAQVGISVPIAEPAAHLEERIVGPRISQKIADAKSLQRQPTGQAVAPDRDDPHTGGLFGHGVIQACRPGSLVYRLDPYWRDRIVKKSQNPRPFEAGLSELVLKDPLKRRNFRRSRSRFGWLQLAIQSDLVPDLFERDMYLVCHAILNR